ncbi:MAG: DEAD/DEAH box helicase [Veillonellales bacterium]
MNQSFEQLGITAPLVAGLKQAGITAPTGVQQRVIPPALQGKDIIGQSATGTGKTLAYLLPLFQKLDLTKREMQAIILTPTHELAIQIQRQIELLAENSGLPVTSSPVIGNVNITRQIEKLREKPHIIVGSSGRILELIQKKKITSQTIKTMVLDEADRLLDDQNLDGVKAVIKTTLRDRQMLLFSATITPAAMEKAKPLLREPEVIQVTEPEAVSPRIEHMYFLTAQRDKLETLRKLVRGIPVEQALVFVNSGDNIDRLVDKLNYIGLKTAGIHGGSVKTDRKMALDGFRSGKIQLLVASDVAARGLDIPGIEYVFNLNLPEDPRMYLHRVGRTGRAGKKGTAISLADRKELAFLGKYEKALKIEIAAKQVTRGRIVGIHQVNPASDRRSAE